MVAIVVHVAVAQLAVVEAHLLGTFLGKFLDTGNVFAFLLVTLNLLEEHFGSLRMHVEIVVEVALEDVEHESLEERTVIGAVLIIGSKMGGAELRLGLCLKDRLLDADAKGTDKALSDILGREFLLVVELLDHTGITLTESALMGTALGCMLTIDKRVIIVGILTVDMGESCLEIVILDVDDGIESRTLHIVLEEIEKAVFGVVALVVVVESKSAIQITIVPDTTLYIFIYKMVVAKKFGVGDKLDEGAGSHEGIVGGEGQNATVGGKLALAEFGRTSLALTKGLDAEIGRERIDSLGTHTVETHGFLEHLIVVLSTCVKLAHCLNHLAQRNTAAIVANRDFALSEVDRHFHTFTETRGELIDGIVDDLLDEDVNAVVMGGAVTEFTDVHTRTETDVFHIFEVDDAVVAIVG